MKTVKILMVAVIVTGAAAYARAVEGAGTPAAPGQSVAVSTAADMEKLSTMPLDTLKVKTKAAKNNRAYRIDVEKDNIGVPLKVKFISPEGKTIKTMSPDEVIIAESGKSLIHKSGYRESPDYDYAEYEREVMDAEGNVKWRKNWRNYPEYGVDPEGGFSGWFEGISDNGERSYVTYRSTDGVYNLIVLGGSGEEIAKVSYPKMLSSIGISPDGKIVGAETFLPIGNKELKHLFFLEVDTGKTKLVRAEGEGWWGGFFLSGAKPLILGQILLWLEKNNISESYQRFNIEFANLPNNMTELIQPGGEKK